jgi:hypothetical protein
MRVIEYVTFTLVPPSATESFPGCRPRDRGPGSAASPASCRAACRGDGRPLDRRCHLGQPADAEAAPPVVMADPPSQPFMALIDGPSARMRHETLALTLD